MSPRQRLLAAILVTTILCGSAFAAHAQEVAKDQHPQGEDDPYADHLLGNWSGLRSKLADKGVELTVEYKGDLWSVRSGGLSHGTSYQDNLDLKAEFDNEKLLGIKGNKAALYFLNNGGSTANANRVGSVQGIDNIETPNHSFKLYEAWDEQTLLHDKLAILLGLRDLNAEFDETDMSA